MRVIESALPILTDGELYRVTSPFGLRVDPVTGEGRSEHKGIDLVLWKSGSSLSGIGAAWDGRVTAVRGTVEGYSTHESAGNYVIIDHGGGVVTKYYHLAHGTLAVAAGERVCAGQYIGMMGATGYVTGAHLHFQLEIDGVPVDPAPYIERLGEEAEYLPIGGTPEADADAAEAPSEWAAEAVAWAQARGILFGDGEGNRRLREPCTREMALVFLWRAMGGLT